MRKKKIIGITVIFLVIGIGIFLLASKPETQISEVISKSVKTSDMNIQETMPDEPENDKAANEDEQESNADTTGQIKSFFQDAVNNTIAFFTNKNLRIVAIGDSLTQGVGDSTGNGGYVGILDKTINEQDQIAEIKNYGKRGNRSDQLLKRLDNPKISASIKKASIVLITIGANDIMKVVKHNITNLTYSDFTKERSEYEDRLNQIFEKINKLNSNTEIYLLGFYNPFEKYFTKIKELDMIVNEWNKTGKSVADRYDNVTFIPTIDLFTDNQLNLFAEDNFHPNTLGYERMAKRVLNYLMK